VQNNDSRGVTALRHVGSRPCLQAAYPRPTHYSDRDGTLRIPELSILVSSIRYSGCILLFLL
jgi:hypothetical protein